MEHTHNTDLAWAAGFLDGEGCWGILRGHNRSGSPRTRFRLSTSQADRRPLDRLVLIAKIGKVNGPYLYASNKLGKKESYRWQITGPRALGFTQLLWPYLSEPKQEQIKRVCSELTLACPGDIMSLDEREDYERHVPHSLRR